MKKYELMYILKPTLDPEALKNQINDLNNVITSQGGNIIEFKEMGLKDLAYEINKFKKGYYVWILAELSNDGIAEFKRVIRITENVIRNIEVNVGA
ncbi:30S ribosomal protein S6 [Acholeplasma equifetale]|uniref:30S ribosomal protein S6 n=1 Tax=Acholeplasma equifetale TaxID=264634 RepID=UPI00047A7DD8|nr:30S ribosomal protein S6 [Acholeplasma equifetale]